MNDEFLHRLRADPPARLAATLKARLDRLAPARAPAPRRHSALRTTFVALMLGGAAFAVTAISVRGVPPALLKVFGVDRPSASAVASDDDAVRRRPSKVDLSTSPALAKPRITEPVEPPSRVFETERGNPAATATPAGSSAAASTDSASVPPTVIASGRATDAPYVVASRATYPLAKAVADHLEGSPQVRIDTFGEGRAFDALCSGRDRAFPDIAVTSRRMTRAELETCRRNAAFPVQEMHVGHQAIVLAQGIGGPELNLRARDVYLALAARAPLPDDPSRIHINAATMWQQIGLISGVQQIQFVGPPVASFMGNALLDLLIEPGCRDVAPVRRLIASSADATETLCRSVRTDGLYVESTSGERQTEQRVRTSPGAIGVFSYNYYYPSRGGLTAATIDGAAPTIDNIRSGTYPAARAFHVYVKVPGFRERRGVQDFVWAVEELSDNEIFAGLGITTAPRETRRLRTLNLKDLEP